MNFLDTNFLFGIITGKDEWTKEMVNKHFILSQDTFTFISIVSKAELLTHAKINNWGKKKMDAVSSLLENVKIVEINNDQKLIDRYIEIDVFSRRNKMGAIRMGKNDLWIASQASILKCKLFTLDKDFNHLIESGFIPEIIVKNS